MKRKTDSQGWQFILQRNQMTAAGIRVFAWLLLALPVLSAAATAGWQVLLEPRELAEILQQNSSVKIIQVTGNYDRGHIPGSIESPYADWRGTGRNPGQLRNLSHYTAMVQQLGINETTPVVVVHEGSDPADMGAATRVYWTLKTLGIKQVAVINGGLQGWRQAGLPISDEPAEVVASTYRPQWNSNWRVTTAEVEELVTSGSGNLIDARPVSFYRGLRASLGEPGTISGAGNIEYQSWFDGDRLQSGQALAERLDSYGELTAPVTVSFCNTGHWASINWFVISELLKVDNTRLYAESVAEWSEQERPMDNQVGRFRVYRDLTARWLNDLLGN